MRRRLVLLCGVLAAVLLLTACGEKKDTLTPASAARAQHLSVMLDWLPNADHVGLYEAMADGDFTKAGLDVSVHAPTDPSTPLALLAAGKVDVAISYEPELMLARDKGEQLAAIGAIVQRPLTSIISLPSKHVSSPAQLRGKTVGDAGIPYQRAYLSTILNQAAVPSSSVKEVNVGTDLVGAMLSGKVAATIGGYWNYEAIQLREAGRKPNVIPVDKAGVPPYDELVLVVRQNEIANNGNELRRFVQALGRGYEAVQANPQAGVRALLQANPTLNAKLQSASVKATLSSFFPSGSSLPWGWQNQAQWTSYGEWMLNHKLITNATSYEGAATNQLLAGQGP